MKAFTDDKDGYYQFYDDAPAEWHRNLTPTAVFVPPPKTAQDLDDELTAEANQAFDLTPKDKTILKQLFLIRKQLNPALTLAQFRAELISDYKSFK